MLDEGQKARADSGNHLIAILYSHQKCGLDNICDEVKLTSTLEVDEEIFFLGGDLEISKRSWQGHLHHL